MANFFKITRDIACVEKLRSFEKQREYDQVYFIGAELTGKNMIDAMPTNDPFFDDAKKVISEFVENEPIEEYDVGAIRFSLTRYKSIKFMFVKFPAMGDTGDGEVQYPHNTHILEVKQVSAPPTCETELTTKYFQIFTESLCKKSEPTQMREMYYLNSELTAENAVAALPDNKFYQDARMKIPEIFEKLSLDKYGVQALDINIMGYDFRFVFIKYKKLEGCENELAQYPPNIRGMLIDETEKQSPFEKFLKILMSEA